MYQIKLKIIASHFHLKAYVCLNNNNIMANASYILQNSF